MASYLTDKPYSLQRPLNSRLSRKKTCPKISEIKEIKVRRVKWLKGIDVKATSIEEIDDFITFKITEYIYYDF